MRSTQLAVVALLSLSMIALELVWTRIFSAEFFYAFAFLVLSLAVLGLGLGALALRLAPGLGARRWLPFELSAAAVMMVVAPVAVLRLGLDFAKLAAEPSQMARFALGVLLLSSAYFFGGVALSSLFRRYHDHMPRLYMADLVGAAAGVALVMLAMNTVGTPAATMLCPIPMLAAAAIAARGVGRALPLLLAAGVLALAPAAEQLLSAEREERAPVIYTHWDAMAKLKLFDFGGEYRGINIDNVANSPVYPFDGDFSDPELADAQWPIDVSYLIDSFDSCRFMSLGAGGGGDVLQALVEGAAEVHAVEVNPHINRMMVEGDPAGYHEAEPASHAGAEGEAPPAPAIRDENGEIITLARFSGHIYTEPRVRVVSEDARTYVRRHRDSFDLIYSLSSNTWAALGSGSFAFAENYIFTVEAFEDYWRALSPRGFLSMEHQVYMPRLVSAAMSAMDRLGVAAPASHLAIYDLPQMRRQLMLLSKQPLDETTIRMAYGELTEARAEQIRLLYPLPTDAEPNLIQRIIDDGWRAVAADASIDVSPSTDDRPFVAQTGLWRNFSFEALKSLNQWAEFRGFPLAKAIIVAILGVVVLLVLPATLLPYLRLGERMHAAPWLYFAAIGAAFMSVEIVLIQKYALCIGASVYSISAVLLTLLLASGLGSRLSRHVGDAAVFTGIVVLILGHAFVAGMITDAASAWPLWARLAVVATLVMPLGFFMGMPFPKAALRVGELVDWGFAVNGAASVLGGTGIMLVAFSFGFQGALLVAAALYLCAYLLLRANEAW